MLSISIQAGGQSSRMGRDKALMPFLGQPLIHRVMERLQPIADEILITTNHPEAYTFLGVPIFKDIIPDAGALGGLYTALKVSSNPIVAVVACDLPFANPNLLAACRDLMDENRYDAVIPSGANGLEPLHAVYRVEGCFLPVQTALETGKRRVISWHEGADIHILPTRETARYDPHDITFWNVNTMEEFREAEKLAQ